MKKHFLLLMMAFMSLAGWAQSTDITGYTVEFTTNNAVYTGSNQKDVAGVKLTKAGESDITTGFKVTWSPSEPTNVISSGYSVSVEADMKNTFGSPTQTTAKFYVLKAASTLTNTPALAAGRSYNGEPLTLVATVPTVTFGTVKYSTDNGTTWSTTVPTETNPGVYEVWYKVDDTDNYDGIAKTKIGTSVEIEGLVINSGDYTAPAAISGLKFQYASNAAVPQDLITAGSIPAAKGVMEYNVQAPGASAPTAWSTTIPQGTIAGAYTVNWRISGQNGYANVAGTAITVNIAKETPVITNPTVATSLVYNGLDQALLSAAATATFGASVTYAVNYKANAEATTWTSVSTGLTELSAVTGKNAGIYQIVTSAAEQANTLAATSVNTEVTIGLADAFTAAPTAKDLTWNNADQVLITAGTGTVDGVVEYQLIDKDGTTELVTWTTTLSAIKAKRAGTYTVKYRVGTSAPNYKPITATAIPVTIKKKVLSVKVNNATKTYDSSTSLTSATVDGGGAKFTFLGEISTANDFSALTDWATTTVKDAGTHTGALTVLTATLEGINTAKNYDYDYAVIPGNLTINQKEIWVEAKTGLTTAYGVARNISEEYNVNGLVGTDKVVDRTVGTTTYYGAFSVAPVLTSNAGENPAIGTYALSFTEGTLKTNGNYKLDLTKGTNGYVIPTGANFKVEANADSKVVITVLPQTQAYTGAAESWDELVKGTHYAVTGLIGDDQIDVSGLTFTREDATNFNVGTYALEATGAAIPTAIAAKYPGGIVYNPSTFEITPKELTATVAQQTVTVGATALPDADAWTVTGLVAADEATGKSVLGGSLSIVSGKTASAGLKTDAILLTITNTNYSLKSGTQYGKLNVIAATGTLFLDDSKADNLEKIAEKDGTPVDVQIQFNRDATLGGARTWAAGEWNTMVLPFDISVAELSQKLGYAIFNVIDPSRTVVDGTGSKFYGKLTMTGGNGKDDVLAANKPFLVKTAQAIPNEKIIDFGTQTIVAPTVGGTVVDAGGDCKFVGTYEKKTVTKDDNAAIWFMLGNNAGWAYINTTSSASWDIVPFAGYIDMSGVPAGARSITFYAEELDGSVTAIKSISTDNSSKLSGEGWYNLNGVKLDGAPSKKGIYIQNGKKVVVK